jgi:ArsR family transcriptional regulator
MFRAFADETRLRILNLLARKRDLCVCDIQKILGVSQPKVSRHLAYLRNAGLVNVRKEGIWKHYSLTKPKSGFHRGLIGCLSGCFSEVTALQGDLKTLKKIQSQKAACR